MITKMSTVLIQTDKGCYKGMGFSPLKNRTIEFTAQKEANGSDDDQRHATPGTTYACDSDKDDSTNL